MKKIALLTGWTGTEIEVAKKSANFFKTYLQKDFDDFELPKDLEDFIKNKNNYNLAIPVFHWEYGEDGKIFAFLDVLGIPHTFSDYNVHSLCLDKYKTNILAENLWIKIPKQCIFHTEKNSYLEILEKLKKEKLDFPLIFKPNTWWSSFYTYKIDSEKDLQEKFALCKKEKVWDILLQEFIIWEEYSISIVNREVLPIMKVEKKKKDDFFDYDSKYENEEKMKETWPEIEKNLKNTLEKSALDCYDFFNVKWFCRVDFLVRNDEVFFLEINTIPGMTESSILPKSWKLTWKSFEELVEKITE